MYWSNFYFKTAYLFFCFLCLSYSTKTYADCTFTLKKAQEAFDEGRINEIATMLAPCLQKGFDRTEKIVAYHIQTLAYLYLNEEEKATVALLEMLKLDPEYQLKPTEPSEFLALYKKFRIVPIVSFGAKMGANFFKPVSQKTFSTDNSYSNSGSYKSNVGFQFGMSLEIPINKKFEIVYETYFTQKGYQYLTQLFSYANLDFKERLTTLEIPLLFKYNIGNKYNFRQNRLNPFVYAGMSANLVLSSTATLTRRDNVSADIQREVTGASITTTDLRKPFNFSAVIGGGIEYKRGRGNIILDVRYSFGLTNAVNTSTRYNNNELIFKYGYVDNDMLFNQFSFYVGYVYPFYKPKKIK